MLVFVGGKIIAMTRTRTALIISLALVWVALLRHCGREELPSCNDKFKGKWVSRTELTEILKQHEAWLKDSSTGDPDDLPEVALGSNDPRRGHLCDASVFDGYLSGADLRGANLRGANLEWAKLPTMLLEANLRDANLRGADLTNALLR